MLKIDYNKYSGRVIIGIIILYPLLFVSKGLDFTDMGYWLSNYSLIFSHPESVGSHSCYLSNIIGGAWLVLFDRLGVIGIRLAYCLVIYLSAWAAYCLLKNFFERNILLLSILISVFYIANSANWMGYNNLTSLFYVLTALFAFRAFATENLKWFFLSGLAAALNIFIRFPNIMGLIIPAAVLLFFLHKTGFRKSIKAGFFSGAGFLTAVFAVLIFMLIFQHMEYYVKALGNLIDTAASSSPARLHSVKNLKMLFIEGLQQTFITGIVFVIFLLSGFLISVIFYPVRNRAIASALGLCSGIIFFLNYDIFKLIKENIGYRIVEYTGLMFLLSLVLFFSIYRKNKNERLIIILGLIVLICAPLGSSNGIRNSVYGMWVLFPFVLSSFFSMGPALKMRYFLNKNSLIFLKTAMVTLVIAFSVDNDWNSVYRDRPEREKLSFAVNHPHLKGIYTTRSRARVVQELLDETNKYFGPGNRILAVESMPLIYYLTDTVPYLSSPWPFLFQPGRFRTELNHSLEKYGLPPVIYSKSQPRRWNWPNDVRSGLPDNYPDRENRKILAEFLKENNYRQVWENKYFRILIP